jgi:hypothetical protein
MKNSKTFSETPNLGGKLAGKSIEKGRFLVGSHMFQVQTSYVFTYHLKASKGIPLVDKIGENLAATSQS